MPPQPRAIPRLQFAFLMGRCFQVFQSLRAASIHSFSILLIVYCDVELLTQPVQSLTCQPVSNATVIFGGSTGVTGANKRFPVIVQFSAIPTGRKIIAVRPVKRFPMPMVWELIVKTDTMFCKLYVFSHRPRLQSCVRRRKGNTQSMCLVLRCARIRTLSTQKRHIQDYHQQTHRTQSESTAPSARLCGSMRKSLC